MLMLVTSLVMVLAVLRARSFDARSLHRLLSGTLLYRHLRLRLCVGMASTVLTHGEQAAHLLARLRLCLGYSRRCTMTVAVAAL